MECSEVKKWISPLLDGEIEAGGRCQPIREHLARCPACREEYQLLLEVKELVREQAPRERAPIHLRERVLNGLERERERQAFAWRRAPRRSLPRSLPALAAAAMVLLFLGIAYYSLFEAPATSLAEGFVREHLRYEVAQSFPEPPGSDPRLLSAQLQREVDFPLEVPDLREIELSLVGGRVLSLEGRKVVHLLYARSGHKISLFVLKGDEMRLPLERVRQGGTTFSVGGYQEMALVSWREGKLDYLLICQGQEKVPSLMRCALLVRKQAGTVASPQVNR